jgi:hypothetical protein
MRRAISCPKKNLASSNYRENSKNITFNRLRLLPAVPGIEHRDADVSRVDSQALNYLSNTGALLIFFYFRDKPVVAEVGKKFYRQLHLVVYSIKVVIKNKKTRSAFKTANLKIPPRHLSRLSGLEVPEGIYLFTGKINNTIVWWQWFQIEKFRQPIIRVVETGGLIEALLGFQD